MKKRVLGVLLCVLLVASGTGFAAEGAFDADNFSTTIILTTDYVSKGVSVSDEGPALQGTFDYTHPSGVFAGIWASSWHSGEASNDLELGYYLGYGSALGKIDYSASATYYTYPGADDVAGEWDYWEFAATAGYTFDQVALRPTLGVGYTFSPNTWGEDGLMHYANATLNLVLPLKLGLGFELGYMDVAGDKITGNGAGLDGGDGYNYLHLRTGISYAVVGFDLDLSYHTNSEKDYFGDAGDDRLVFTLSRTF